MPEDNLGERTEAATPRKRQDARERGHVARSIDLSSAAILLAAVLAFEFFGQTYVGGLFSATRSILERLGEVDGDPQNLMLHYGGAVGAALLGMVPFMAIVTAAALGVNLLQVGFIFTPVPLTPSLERLDPIAGLGRLLSARALIRLLGGLLKVMIVGGVVFWTIWAERARLVNLIDESFEDILTYGVAVMLKLSLRAALLLLILALLEYAYQKWQYEKDLRMSRQEVREEMKRYEGDPKIRERRRGIQRQLALQRMMQSVPKATVVITNPTHVAVALEYEPEKMEAPKVVAKGAEFLAQRIREIALEHGVPIVQRPELARAIYKTVEVGQTIPYDLYKAVAEIMAYVFRLKKMGAVA